MERRKITLAVSKELLQQIRAVASARKQTLSELLQEALEEKIGVNSAYEAARRRQLAMLRHGFDLGTKGNASITRTDIYDL
mgnify:CR=1 FL=1